MTFEGPDGAAKLEPCQSCGEETAIGSYFYSSRHEGHEPDGTKTFLCADCVERKRTAGRPSRQKDVDLGSAAAIGTTLNNVQGL